MWFAGAEEVEVGAVEEEDAFGHLPVFPFLFLLYASKVCIYVGYRI